MRPATAFVAVTAGLLALPAIAGAAPVSPSSNKVAGATTVVSSCGSLNGMTVSWTSVADVVSSIVLGSVPSACNGATLSLTLVGTGNAPLGTAGPVTISGTSQTLSSISGSPTATSVTQAFVSVVGP